MSPVVELPQHLLLVFLTVLAGDNVSPVPGTSIDAAPILSAVATSTDDNPYQLAPQTLFDALAGLKSDRRFARYADRVFKTSSGEAYAPVKREAAEMLALRRSPLIAQHLTESYARANAIALQEALGRRVTVSDLYLAHRVGLRHATEIRRVEQRSPDAVAAIAVTDLDDVAPDLLFYGDRALSIGDISRYVERGVDRSMNHMPRIAIRPSLQTRPLADAATDDIAAAATVPRTTAWRTEVRRQASAEAAHTR